MACLTKVGTTILADLVLQIDHGPEPRDALYGPDDSVCCYKAHNHEDVFFVFLFYPQIVLILFFVSRLRPWPFVAMHKLRLLDDDGSKQTKGIKELCGASEELGSPLYNVFGICGQHRLLFLSEIALYCSGIMFWCLLKIRTKCFFPIIKSVSQLQRGPFIPLDTVPSPRHDCVFCQPTAK